VIPNLWIVGSRPLTMFVLELDGPGRTGVQGRLLTSDGTAAAAGITVELHLGDICIAQVRTLDHGSFAFGGLATGEYALVLPNHNLRLPVVLSYGAVVDIGDMIVQSLRAPKPLAHYVLFDSDGSAAERRTNVMLALDQVLELGLAAGFSPQQATLAERVLVVGDSSVLSLSEEKKLRDGGSEVLRVDAEHLAMRQPDP
jgi:hypothetical protein